MTERLIITGRSEDYYTTGLLESQKKIDEYKKDPALSRFKRALRNMWFDATSGYRRQKYMEESVKERTRTSYLEGPLASAAAQTAVQTILDERTIEKAKVRQVEIQLNNDITLEGTEIADNVNSQIRNSIVKDVLIPLVQSVNEHHIETATLNDSQDNPTNERLYYEAEAQRKLQSAVEQLDKNLKGPAKTEFDKLLGRKSNRFGVLNSVFANNIVDKVQVIAEKYNEYYAETNPDERMPLDEFVRNYTNDKLEIVLAKTDWGVDTKLDHNVDVRAVSWLNKHEKVNGIISASLVGLGVSLGAFALMRVINNRAVNSAAHIVAPGLGIVTAGVVRAIDTNRRLKIENAVNRANAVVDGSADISVLVPASKMVKEMNVLLSAPSSTENLDKLEHLAMEAKARLDLSVISRFDYLGGNRSEGVMGNIDINRMLLVEKIAEAKAKLQENGRTGKITPRFEDNPEAAPLIAEKKAYEREEKNNRRIRSFISGALGGLAGGAIGLVWQEGLAGIGRITNIPSDTHVLGGLFARGETGIEKTLRWITNRDFNLFSTESTVNSYQVPGIGTEHTISLDSNYKLTINTRAQDPFISIIDSHNKAIISEPFPSGSSEIHIKGDPSQLPSNLVSELKEHGFTIQDTSKPISNVIPHSTTYTTETIESSVRDQYGTASHPTSIPKDAVWEMNPDMRSQNLVIHGPEGQIDLLKNATFDQNGKLIGYSEINPDLKEIINTQTIGGGVKDTDSYVIAKDGNEYNGLWHDHASKLDTIHYNSAGTLTVHPNAVSNTFCSEDGPCNEYSFTGKTNNTGFSFNTKVVEGANPALGKALEFQGQFSDHSSIDHPVYTFLMHGDRSMDNALVAVGTMDTSINKDAVQSFTDGVFKLDPTDTSPNHLVKFENGSTMQMGLFSRMILDPADLNKMDYGLQTTYGTSVLREVIEIGSLSKTVLPDGSTHLIQTTQSTLMPCKTDIPAFLHVQENVAPVKVESSSFALKDALTVTHQEVLNTVNPEYTIQIPDLTLAVPSLEYRTVIGDEAAPIPVWPVPALFNRSTLNYKSDYNRAEYAAMDLPVNEAPLPVAVVSAPPTTRLPDVPQFDEIPPGIFSASTPFTTQLPITLYDYSDGGREATQSARPLNLQELDADMFRSFGPYYRNIADNFEEMKQFAENETLLSAEVYKHSLEEALPILETKPGLIELNKSIPTLIVPALQGDGTVLIKSLTQTRESDGKTYYDLLRDDQINVVVQGNWMDISDKHNWPDENSHTVEYNSRMEQISAQLLGTMKLVMDLVKAHPDTFVFLLGEQDNPSNGKTQLLNSDDKTLRFYNWIQTNFGSDFLEKVIKSQESLPLMAKGDNFIVSHAAPSGVPDYKPEGIGVRGYTKEEIADKKIQAQNGLTLTEMDNSHRTRWDHLAIAFVETLDNLGLRDPRTLWFIGNQILLHKNVLSRFNLENRLFQLSSEHKKLLALLSSGGELEKVIELS